MLGSDPVKGLGNPYPASERAFGNQDGSSEIVPRDTFGDRAYVRPLNVSYGPMTRSFSNPCSRRESGIRFRNYVPDWNTVPIRQIRAGSSDF